MVYLFDHFKYNYLFYRTFGLSFVCVGVQTTRNHAIYSFLFDYSNFSFLYHKVMVIAMNLYPFLLGMGDVFVR